MAAQSVGVWRFGQIMLGILVIGEGEGTPQSTAEV